MADKKFKKANSDDLKSLAICEAFTLADNASHTVWVASRKKPGSIIGYVEAINLDERKVTIGVEGEGHHERDLRALVLYSKPKKAKPVKYPPIQNKLYTVEHVHDLIDRAIHIRNRRDGCDGDSAFSNGADAHFQLTAIVELLENIVVFNIGDGVNGFKQGGVSVGSNVSDRLDSFIVAFPLMQAAHSRKRKKMEKQ